MHISLDVPAENVVLGSQIEDRDLVQGSIDSNRSSSHSEVLISPPIEQIIIDQKYLFNARNSGKVHTSVSKSSPPEQNLV
jgi:hypothetical protein